MGKARRLKMLKQQQRQKAELIQNGISFISDLNTDADIFIVTVPGVGSVDVTPHVKKELRSLL